MSSVALLSSACSSLDVAGLTSVERNFQQRPYAGAGVLVSQLDPNVRQFDDVSVDEDQSVGASLTLGYDLTSRWAVEAHFADLGEASLDPRGSVRYRVGGVSALLYGFNESRDRARREGLSFYGRAGIGTLDGESDLPVEVVNDVHLVLGAGLEYGLANALAGRLEVVSHDSDASHVQLGLIYRFGRVPEPRRSRSRGQSQGDSPVAGEESGTSTVAPDAEPADATESAEEPDAAESVDGDTSAAITSPTTRDIARPEPSVVPGSTVSAGDTEPAPERPSAGLLIDRRESTSSDAPGLIVDRRQGTPESEASEPLIDRRRATPEAEVSRQSDDAVEGASEPREQSALLIERRSTQASADEDDDGVIDSLDQCPNTREGLPVDASGCEVFDGVIDGVTFQIASNRLTDGALDALSEVAAILEAYPDIRVSIDAHTDDRGDARSNLLLSKRRALEVTRYLVDQGIAGNRLVPKAYGETQPIGDNETSEGRRANRRVEIRILE